MSKSTPFSDNLYRAFFAMITDPRQVKS